MTGAWEIERSRMEKKPILIYKGADICYNILNVFAQQFGEALTSLGEEVIYYDVEKEGLSGLANFVGKDFKAIVGFQTYAYDPFLASRQQFLHDLVTGPKFNFQFDHPIWMRAHYEKVPKDLYVLTHDRNYVAFIRTYYPEVRDALLLPPGGICKEVAADIRKTGDLIFLGTYRNYREYFPVIRNSPREIRFLANAYLLEMKRSPNETAEEALRIALERRGIKRSGEDFLQLMDALKPMIYCMMSYYRERVIRLILDAGIGVAVYGDSWKSSPFRDDEKLLIRPEVSPEESLTELSRSKLSLNVMAWHKDGYTERIANSMLCRSVVITDRSTRLEERFSDGEELVLFDLTKLPELPEKIRALLSDEKLRETMAEKAYRIASTEDTWRQRAEEFLQIVEERKCS